MITGRGPRCDSRQSLGSSFLLSVRGWEVEVSRLVGSGDRFYEYARVVVVIVTLCVTKRGEVHAIW